MVFFYGHWMPPWVSKVKTFCCVQITVSLNCKMCNFESKQICVLPITLPYPRISFSQTLWKCELQLCIGRQWACHTWCIQHRSDARGSWGWQEQWGRKGRQMWLWTTPELYQCPCWLYNSHIILLYAQHSQALWTEYFELDLHAGINAIFHLLIRTI